MFSLFPENGLLLYRLHYGWFTFVTSGFCVFVVIKNRNMNKLVLKVIFCVELRTITGI